jgi:hypothetical protein
MAIPVPWPRRAGFPSGKPGNRFRSSAHGGWGRGKDEDGGLVAALRNSKVCNSLRTHGQRAEGAVAQAEGPRPVRLDEEGPLDAPGLEDVDDDDQRDERGRTDDQGDQDLQVKPSHEWRSPTDGRDGPSPGLGVLIPGACVSGGFRTRAARGPLPRRACGTAGVRRPRSPPRARAPATSVSRTPDRADKNKLRTYQSCRFREPGRETALPPPGLFDRRAPVVRGPPGEGRAPGARRAKRRGSP